MNGLYYFYLTNPSESNALSQLALTKNELMVPPSVLFLHEGVTTLTQT